VPLSPRQPGTDSHAWAGAPKTCTFKTCQVSSLCFKPPHQLSSHTRSPLTLHLLARIPSRQCHFVFRVMRNNDVWILSLDGDKDCHINWRRAKVTSTTITHNNNIDFGLIVSRVKDLLKRQTYFMFRLGFEKALFGFVQNLVVEALECFGMLTFKCLSVSIE